ncbi:RND superfamily putative drug exporter [Motilibacter rhizosphaerae]|uniref:RND superfamily putative drug exporter n=1 Tax=Motilibacter rhizosphaerae TaxID=598652 RepID=A0A4Q7NU05_9ACTN|nr:MMPL family transporter [Motilibacter rhizosphaerae]RZS90318.1 RND superfamily putative drug exporter [Motilibacter rhizosphaerae]
MSASSAPPRPPAPLPTPVPGVLGRVASFSFRRRWSVLALWIVAVVAAATASSLWGGSFSADYTVRGSDSRAATDLLKAHFPSQAGDTIDIAVRTAGPVTAQKAEVQQLLDGIRAVPHVAAVDDPFTSPGDVSQDGRTVLTHARLDVTNPVDMPKADAQRVIDLAVAASKGGTQVAVGGQSIDQAQQGAIGSEGIGLVAAALVLLLAFGSVVAAGLPILTAVLGLGVSASLVGVVAAITATPDWSTSLASMMGIGVGIDYVLLLVSRYRENLASGREPQEAVIATAETAGRSVLIAGTTVVISMLGLFGMGLSYMRGAALATIVAVLVVMLAAATAVPAMLGVVGRRVNSLRIPFTGRSRPGSTGLWVRWSRTVQRRPVVFAALGVAVLAVLALPLSTLRFGFPDSGNVPKDRQVRQEYDMAAAAFGKGANGPLLLAAELGTKGSTASLDRLTTALRSTEGVAAVTPATASPDGTTAVLTVVPTTGPQASATEDLVKRLRHSVVPTATRGTGDTVHVGGVTASAIDSTDDVSKRLPLLVAGVVGLSMLLLLVAFRSVVVAVKAAVMNLISIAAAYGVVSLVLQGGWAGKLVGIETATPLPAFIPVLMFAILFGLSMDYEVFLLSRMREWWVRTGDNSRAVSEGLAGTGRIITAAAAIMVAVFAAFVPAPDVILKVIGVGLASAILIDATVVRMLLVPAVMQLLGTRNWWIPASWDRRLPDPHIEGRPEFHLPEEELALTAAALPGQRTERTGAAV